MEESDFPVPQESIYIVLDLYGITFENKKQNTTFAEIKYQEILQIFDNDNSVTVFWKFRWFMDPNLRHLSSNSFKKRRGQLVTLMNDIKDQMYACTILENAVAEMEKIKNLI